MMTLVLMKLLALYLGSTPLCAQTVGATQLLTRGPGAEGAALSGTIVSTVHDPTALYWNPAGLAAAGGMVSGEHLFLYDGARYDFIGLSVPSRAGTFGLGALQLNRGGIVARQAVDDPGTSVSNTQSIYLLGFGRPLTEHWSVGATANVLDFNLAGYKDKGWGVDTGAQGSYPQDEFWGLKRLVWSFGAQIKNLIEPKITLMSDTESFPRELRGGAGLSFQTASRASANGVVSYDRAMILLAGRKVSGEPGLHPGLGLAYDYQNILVFRAGFDGTLSAGVGFHTPDGKFIVDYSMENRPLALSHRFTMSYRFLTPKAKPKETYAEEIDAGYEEARTQAQALARENTASGDGSFKDQNYRAALGAYRLASVLDPDNRETAVSYRRAQEAYRRQRIQQLSTDAVLDPASGQEAQAFSGVAELLDLGADNRALLVRRLGAIGERLSATDRARLTGDLTDKRLAAARLLIAAGDLAEARRIEDTLDVVRSTQAADAVSALEQETASRSAAVRKALDSAAAEASPDSAAVLAAMAARRAFPDDSSVSSRAGEVVTRYRSGHPLSLKERFYLRKLYYLSALRYARRSNDDLREAGVYLAEVRRRNPADVDADTLLDAMAREGLAQP